MDSLNIGSGHVFVVMKYCHCNEHWEFKLLFVGNLSVFRNCYRVPSVPRGPWVWIFQFLAALNFDIDSEPSTHGQMTAVFCCRTTCVWTKRSFDLIVCTSQWYSLHSVLGLHTLLSMGITLKFPLDKLICSKIKFNFPLSLYLPGKWLPDEIYLS